MPFLVAPYQATDDKMLEAAGTVSSFNMFWSGTPFLQYGAATSYTNSNTETSLYAGITTYPVNGQASTNTANFGINSPSDCSTLAIPGGALTPGSILKTRMFGTIATTGTPTLRIRAGYVNGAGTFAAIDDTGTPTLGAITGTADWSLDVEVVVLSIGLLGSVGTRMTLSYSTNSTTGATTVLTFPFTVTSSIDTTQSYTYDVRATWGAISASNILINKAGYIQVIG
jgi:hypothetical protein